MKWKNLLKVAFKSILKNGMRSLLTMLGIVIGVGAVIVMVAVGEGSQARITGQIANLGTNLIMIRSGTSMMGSQDDVVLAPATTVLYRLSGSQYVRMIVASAVSEEQMTAAQEEITAILRRAHRLSPGEEDDFNMRTQTEITDMATGVTETLTALLGAIAAVSLVVGGIGIMNIMLVSVTERTREIGLRLAIGARGRDVLTQFLVEAVVLSFLGGLIGILLATGIAFALTYFFGISTVIDPAVVLLACAFSGAVGVFFGFYPARKAAALNPIEALRYE